MKIPVQPDRRPCPPPRRGDWVMRDRLNLVRSVFDHSSIAALSEPEMPSATSLSAPPRPSSSGAPVGQAGSGPSTRQPARQLPMNTRWLEHGRRVHMGRTW
jgi:hypothetical protein